MSDASVCSNAIVADARSRSDRALFEVTERASASRPWPCSARPKQVARLGLSPDELALGCR